MNGEMFGFWMMTGFGMFFLLVMVGAGINTLLRARALFWTRLQGVTIEKETQSLSEKAKEDE